MPSDRAADNTPPDNDATARRNNDAALTPDDFSRLVEEDTDGLLVLDSAFRVLYMNARAEMELQHTRGDFLGRVLWEALPSLLVTPDYALLSGALRQGIPMVYEVKSVLRPEHWYEVRAVPSFGGDSRLLVYLRDITDRKQAEQALRESEERYHSLVEATAAVVWTTDAQGQFTTPQTSWTDFTGHTWPQHAGFGWAEMLHPDDRARMVSSWQQAVKERNPHYVVEGRLWHQASERYRHILIRAVPILSSDGTLREWVGIIADVDEQRRAEEERAALAARQAHIAETLQRSLLMTPEPNTFAGLELFTHYEPASDEALIGGDFFDAFSLSGDASSGGAPKIALVVADVTGKGLVAAAETAEIKFALRAYLHEYPWPHVALQRLNRYLLSRQSAPLASTPTDPGNTPGVYISMAVIVLDPLTGHGTAVAAGMESPFVLRRTDSPDVPPHAEELPTRGMMLGGLPDWEADSVEFVLQPGDVLLLCTDGLTEARPHRGARDMFGIEGVTHAALDAFSGGHSDSLGSVSDAVTSAARTFAGGRLRDDACLLLARRT